MFFGTSSPEHMSVTHDFLAACGFCLTGWMEPQKSIAIESNMKKNIAPLAMNIYHEWFTASCFASEITGIFESRVLLLCKWQGLKCGWCNGRNKTDFWCQKIGCRFCANKIVAEHPPAHRTSLSDSSWRKFQHFALRLPPKRILHLSQTKTHQKLPLSCKATPEHHKLLRQPWKLARPFSYCTLSMPASATLNYSIRFFSQLPCSQQL